MSSTTTMAAAIVSVNLTTNVRIFFWHKMFEFFSSPSTCAAHMTEISYRATKRDGNARLWPVRRKQGEKAKIVDSDRTNTRLVSPVKGTGNQLVRENL